MKKLLVVFLAVAMIFAFAATAMAADTEIPDYTDMADQKAEWQSAVYRLTALGVLEGNNGVGGAFRPADYITRAELAKIVIYLTGNTDKVAYYAAQAPAFTDVPDGFWAEGYINACKDLGLMKGVGYGKFNPQGTVTFQETATVVLRALGYTDALKGEWPSDYSRKAAEIDLTEYVSYIGPKAITRAELSSIFNEGLDKLMVSYIADSTAQGIAQVLALTAAQIDWWFGIDENTGIDIKSLGVDADGFAYNIFYTNDDDRSANRDLLYYAFEATAGEVQFFDQEAGSTVNGKKFSEANAWGYDDFDDGELLLAYYEGDYDRENLPSPDEVEVASLYYIFGGGLPDLANMQGEVTYNDDDEVLFVGLTSQKVKVDVWKDLDHTYLDDGDKLTVGDAKYKVDLDCGFQVNNDDLSETVKKTGGFGYLFLDEDNHVYDYKEYYQFKNAEYEVFEKLDDSYIYFVSGQKQRISKLPDYALIKDGQFAELADLEFGDLLYEAPLYEGDEVTLYIALSPLTTDKLSKAYTGTDYGFTADGVRYYGFNDTQPFSFFSTDGGDRFTAYDADTELRDEFFDGDDEVTYAPAYAWRVFIYVSIDVESYNYGVLTELDYKAYTQDENILIGVTILMADGTEVEYALEEAYDNSFGPDNELKWTLGSLVEFQLNKDGEIDMLDNGSPDMAFLNNGVQLYWWQSFPTQFTSRFATPGPMTPVEVTVDEDDATIEFDGETYELAEDAEIFVISRDNYEYDDCDIVTAADLLADGDFQARQIAACYVSGEVDTVIDTLWIVDQDLDNDVAMGYQSGTDGRDSSGYYVKLNSETGKPIDGKSLYDAWGAGKDFVAYSLDGDTIDGFRSLISFEDGNLIKLATGAEAGYFGPVTLVDFGAVTDPMEAVFTNTGNVVKSFELDGSDDEYDITVGVLAQNAGTQNIVLSHAYTFNPGDSDTYSYKKIVYFKDIADDDCDDLGDLVAGDLVVLVRDGSSILYAFHVNIPTSLLP